MLLNTQFISLLSLLLLTPYLAVASDAGFTVPLRRHSDLAGRAALQARDGSGSVDFAALERALVHLEARYGDDHPDVLARRERAGAEKRWIARPAKTTGAADAWDGPIKDAAKGLEGLLAWDSPATADDASPIGALSKSRVAVAPVSAALPLRDILSNGRELEFLAEIKIGTPAKSFWLTPDSGSSDTWVKSNRCTTANCGSASRARYTPSASSTYRDTPGSKTFSLQYGIGSVKGRLVRDKVAFGGVKLNSQTLGLATTLSGDWKTDKADGVLGLGFRALSSENQKPFIQNAAEQNSLAKPIVAFAFGRHLSGTEAKSEMSVGRANPALYKKGTMSFYPVTKAGYWQFSFKSFDAAGVAGVKNVDGIIDTGTSLIALSQVAAAQFWAGVPGSKYNEDGQYYTFACNAQVKGTLTMPDGRKIVIDENDMNLGTDGQGSSRCVGAVLPARTPGQVIFGLSLLKNVYTVLNFGESPRIGLATLNF